MVKKFRNTKARQREMKRFDDEWTKVKNKIYYRKSRYNLDFSEGLPIETKRELKNLSTKEIQRINNQLKNINTGKNKSFFTTQKFKKISIPMSMVKEMRKLETNLLRNEEELNKRRAEKNIIIERDMVTRDTVLTRHLMKRPDRSLYANIKPYDFDRASSMKDVESALNVRRKRLDPEWIAERQQTMLDNFKNSIIVHFNDLQEATELTDLMESIQQDTLSGKVVGLLEKLDASDFYELYEQFESLDFSRVPSSKEQITDDERENLQYIYDILQDFLEGNVDTRSKVFNNG